MPSLASHAESRVLGSGDTLSDVISRTYDYKPRKTPAAVPAQKKPIDITHRSGLIKAAPKPSAPFGLFFGIATRVPPEPPPLPILKVKPAAPKPTPALKYRTVCVRLCDGAFFPVSDSVPQDQFNRDEARCKASCSSPAELYVYQNAVGTPDTMEDLEGRPYVRLTTAFQFRVAYDASCTCKPHPWEDAARAIHRQYALNERRKKLPDRRAEFQTPQRLLTTEFRNQSLHPEPPRLAAAATGVMTEPIELPWDETGNVAENAPDTHVDHALTPARKTPPRQWSRRVLLGKGAPGPNRPSQASTWRRSTANDDFMSNFRR